MGEGLRRRCSGESSIDCKQVPLIRPLALARFSPGESLFIVIARHAQAPRRCAPPLLIQEVWPRRINHSEDSLF